MQLTTKIAFGGYLCVALVVTAVGIRYLFASQIMPYHLTAMGSTWEHLSPGAQVMTLNFMKSAGAGFVTTGIAICFLLFFPFRKGERWSTWAILAVSLNEFTLIILRIFNVRMNTPAHPPIAPFIVLFCLAVLSFLLSLGMKPGKNMGNER